MLDLIQFVVEDIEGEKHQYQVNVLPAMKSFKLLQKIAKALGGLEGGISTDTKDAGAMGLMIVGALGDDKVTEVVEELLAYKILRDDKTLNPDVDYTGNLTEMIEVVMELVKINYGHLFKKGKLQAMVEKFQNLKS